MGRSGLDRSRRQHLYEADPSGPIDPNDEDWWWLEGLLMPDETPPEDALAGADVSPEVELSEVDVEEFLAIHTATE